jgi:hypothetical protein
MPVRDIQLDRVVWFVELWTLSSSTIPKIQFTVIEPHTLTSRLADVLSYVDPATISSIKVTRLVQHAEGIVVEIPATTAPPKRLSYNEYKMQSIGRALGENSKEPPTPEQRRLENNGC